MVLDEYFNFELIEITLIPLSIILCVFKLSYPFWGDRVVCSHLNHIYNCNA